MTRIILGCAAVLGLAGAASAQSVADQVAGQFHALGFTRVEVHEGPTQVRIEVLRGLYEVEHVYSLITGDLLSRETRLADGDTDRTGRVAHGRNDEDVVDAGDRDGDDDGDDHGRGHGDRNRGHGNDEDGFGKGNPGRGHGDDERPGGRGDSRGGRGRGTR